MTIEQILFELANKNDAQPYLSPKRREFAPHVVYLFMFSEYHKFSISQIQNTPIYDAIAICDWLLKMGLLEHPPVLDKNDELDLSRYMYVREHAELRHAPHVIPSE